MISRSGLISVLLLISIFICSVASQRVAYAKYGFEKVPDGAGIPPLDREGTAYGNVGGRKIYFAGGVNTIYPSKSSFIAFKDIYTYDTQSNTFIRAAVDLPGPSYFGQGAVLGEKLFVYSGRTNNVNSQVANTYFADMYVVDFGAGLVNPVVTTLVLDPPVSPRQYASGILAKNGLFYIFGGVNGASGTNGVSDVFLTIDTSNGHTKVLPCDSKCPRNAVTNPVVFMNKDEDKLYVYSGMQSDSTTFADNEHVYIYDVDDEQWETPEVVTKPNNLVWNSWGLNADVTRLLLIGGDFGASGSHNKAYAFDLTKDPPYLEPLPAVLPYRCESAMVGIDMDGTAWVYSGAIYNSSNDLNAYQYDHGIVKFLPKNEVPPEYASCMFPEACTEFDLMHIDTGHVVLGLFLSLLGGLGTTAGGLITFLPGAGQGNIWFVGGLGTAGGVMLWISLRELFPTSESYFCCDYNNHYITATTICFFIGLAFGIILDFIVGWASKSQSNNETVKKYLCCKWDDYETIADADSSEMDSRKRLYDNYGDEAATTMDVMSIESTDPADRMTRMGVINAIVVAIHNFPEGVATFMATLADPSLGVAVAIAICSHNIPEGFAIALPLNVGTGNKVRALVYTFFAGMSEPLGALAAWIIFARFIGPWLFGATFGLVSGLIAYISLHEIIPIAHKFDPTDRYSTYFVLFGILLMIVTSIVFIDF